MGEVQHRVGDVSRVAHESFDGALVVKTLGRADRRGRRASTAPPTRSARPPASAWGASGPPSSPIIDALPNLGIIVLLLIGVMAGLHSAGSTPARSCRPSPCSACSPSRCGSSASSSRSCPAAWWPSARLDPGGRATHREAVGRPADAPALPAGPLSVELRRRELPPRRRPAGARRPRPRRRPPARSWPWSAPPVRASPRSASCCPACVDPDSGSVRLGGVDLRDLDPRRRPGLGRAGVPGDLPLRRHACGRT